MKKEQFYELLGELNEDYVKDAENPPVKQKKPHWATYALPAAACLGLVIIAGIFLINHFPASPSKDPSADKNKMALAYAAYPDYPQYPDDSLSSEERQKAYDKWRKARLAAMEQPQLYKKGFHTFFQNTSQTFLSDTKTGNKVYSPLSLYMALGLLAEITGGNTRQQILDVLVQTDITSLRADSKAMWQANYTDDGLAKCILANSLWLNENENFAKNTINTIAENYYSSVYSGDPASANYNKLLQDWLNEQTDGLLSDYSSNIEMNPLTKVLIASTVNFSGKWNIGFSENNTEQSVFHSLTGELLCDFMHAEYPTTYFWGEKFTSVSLGLQRNGEMRLILPDEGFTPADLLTDEELLQYLLFSENHIKNKYVTVRFSVPKFDVSSSIDLIDGLKELGITDAFDFNKANFSPLFSGSDIATENGVSETKVNKAEQDARVMIDEEGCKATALTILAMTAGGMPPADTADFILDRPFLFEIVSETGLPLFVGIVNDPTQN